MTVNGANPTSYHARSPDRLLDKKEKACDNLMSPAGNTQEQFPFLTWKRHLTSFPLNSMLQQASPIDRGGLGEQQPVLALGQK